MFGGDAGSRWWKIPLLPVIRTKTSREYLRLNHGPGKGWGRGWGEGGGGCSYSGCLGPSEVKFSSCTQKNVNMKSVFD